MIEITVNGQARRLDVEPDTPLLWALRDTLGLTGMPPDRMPRVHVRIVESGAPLGGISEPGTPGVPPAVANAVAALTGRRVRSLPLAKARFGAA